MSLAMLVAVIVGMSGVAHSSPIYL
jgi:hypothetical protein